MGKFMMNLRTSPVFTFLGHNTSIIILLHNDVMYKLHGTVRCKVRSISSRQQVTLAVVQPMRHGPL
jgi:hypothetical protein